MVRRGRFYARSTPASGQGSTIVSQDFSQISPPQLVQALFGGAVQILSVSSNCAARAAGLFQNGGDFLPFANAAILSTGNIATVGSPNVSDNATTVNGFPGDADLECRRRVAANVFMAERRSGRAGSANRDGSRQT